MLLKWLAPPLAWATMFGLRAQPGVAVFVWTPVPYRAEVVSGEHPQGAWCDENRIFCTPDHGEPDFDATWHSAYADDGPLIWSPVPCDFVATDGLGGVLIGQMATPADFNADGELGSADFFDFLASWFAGDAAADFNSDGAIDSQDFDDFYACFSEGC